MKKLRLILVAILVIISIVIGGYKIMQKVERDKMVEIVYSKEVKKIIKDDLKDYDKNALSDKGFIKSYKIDDTTIEHNPMGGIQFTVHVNDNKNLYVYYTINKDSQTGKLVNDGGGNSAEFEKLINGDHHE